MTVHDNAHTHSSAPLDTKTHIVLVHVADWHTSFWVILEQDGPIEMGDWMVKASDWAAWVEDSVTGKTVMTRCRPMGSLSRFNDTAFYAPSLSLFFFLCIQSKLIIITFHARLPAKAISNPSKSATTHKRAQTHCAFSMLVICLCLAPDLSPLTSYKDKAPRT